MTKNGLNGWARWAAAALAVIAGVLLTGGIVEVRSNHVIHRELEREISDKVMACTKERSADRERIKWLEAAIYRIDSNIADIKEAVVNLDP